ncbi:MFS transporter, partial [Sinorhizobium medicae]
ATSPLAALGVRGVVPLLAACAAFMAAFYGVYGYIGDHLHAALGLPLSANGLVAVSYGLGFGAAAFLDRLIDRFGAARLLPLIFLAVAGVYVSMSAASGSYTAMLGVVFLWGLCNHFGLNVLIMRLTALDPAKRGAIMGLNSGVTYLALFAGTIGFGEIYALTGFSILPMAAAGLMLTAVFTVALTSR